ncbi:fungal specific transcription factor domain protein [Metarhizium robertsii]|uniref:Zn(II)2Cys6 transcription factor n=2 Tax=Metarhizium robertsii TaxID=568076 RepID=E9ENC1_METRA|nr:Zn(II)2Cys6 transcription factor [Metarhizium robertsii ARSEF 23]EFZ04133.1 Zn(II)2Cys6 transcription factor [Metarhizium robertsii ARSEF 23]EXV00888.1 fungal specific transcription factor domain protein [Metarhizium robertsii]
MLAMTKIAQHWDSSHKRHSDDVLRRLQRLEQAVFNQPRQSLEPPQVDKSIPRVPSIRFTAFGIHLMIPKPDEAEEQRVYMENLANKLPPQAQARLLLEHFAKTSHPNSCILHIPSCRTLLEQTYESICTGGMPPVENLLLLFGIFAAAAFHWSSELLQSLHATRAEAKAALFEYLRVGVSIIDNTVRPIIPSTNALAAMCNLHNVITHARGLSDNDVALRMKCYGMARTLQIDRLDTAKSREERRQKGCNMIEVEVQRRIWWSLVGSDWLNSFSGGPNDGAYFLQPKHMNVRLPANVDDKDVTADMVEKDIPLTKPSGMSGFIHRVKISQICREVVDALPSQFHDADERSYNTILQMDKKFRTFLEELPVYFRLDPESIERSKDICRERPIIALQRVGVNFSIRIRLCRLHRPYHLEGLTNSTYAYSHKACIQEAQKVLDLRRAMDECGSPLGMNPARSWIVMQHVSIAALILATDVSFNPLARDAEQRKAKVLATCELLEKSMEDSESIMEGVQRNVQVLVSTLQKQRSQSASRHEPSASLYTASGMEQLRDAAMADADDDTVANFVGSTDRNNGFLDDLNEDQTDWDQLWKDFIAIAPELDVAHWDLLFEDVQPA